MGCRSLGGATVKRLLPFAFLVLATCKIPIPNPVPVPVPTPTPTPTPPPVVDCVKMLDTAKTACVAGEPWTAECKAAQEEYINSPCSFTHEPVCAEGQTHSCWAQRPGEMWAFVCPVYNSDGGVVGTTSVLDPANCPVKPEPPPEPTPTPTPAPDPTAPPLIEDEHLTADPTDTQKLTFNLTSAAVARWRSKHPEKWNANGSCLIDKGAGIDAAFLAISAELGTVGVVAGQSIKVSGQRSDAIFVNRKSTNRYEETHLFHSGTGCVATSSSTIKMTYIRSGVTPTPPDACTDPQAPPLMKINMKCDKPGKWKCDGTPQVLGFEYKGPGTNYCAEIGLGEMPGQPGVVRRVCPLGNEDNAPRRQCWERRVLGGAALWRSSGDVEVNPSNHLQARCRAGSTCSWIEVCHADGTKCTRVP
jgi:hypothetical protein